MSEPNREIIEDENGIKRCSICGEVVEKEIFLENMNMIFHPTIRCACERAKDEKENAEREARFHREEVDRNRRICFPLENMKNWTFENADCKADIMQKALKYVENWKEMRAKGIGLLLWGYVGTGKTYAAACIANTLLEKEIRVKMTDFATISNISMLESEERFEELMKYDLLIIDDLGAERKSEFALQNVYDVINKRCASGKPLIVTTNLGKDDLEYPGDITMARIYDRIKAMCTPILVAADSRREQVAADKNDICRKILNG